MEYCVLVIKVTLPEGIKPLGTFVLYRFVGGGLASPRGVQTIRTVGVRCGCYAKAHRQIAHIQDKRKRAKGKK